MTTHTMKLSDLHVTKTLQPRGGDICKETVREYAAAVKDGAKFPRLIAYTVTDRSFKTPALVAGFHRYEAYKVAEVGEVEVEVHEGTFAEAWLAGYRSNLTNGLRYTTSQKRAAAETALLLYRDQSARFVAELIGVSHNFVTDVRKELVAAGKIEGRETVRSKDGTEHPAKVKPNSEIVSSDDTISEDGESKEKQSRPSALDRYYQCVECGTKHPTREGMLSCQQKHAGTPTSDPSTYKQPLDTSQSSDGGTPAEDEKPTPDAPPKVGDVRPAPCAVHTEGTKFYPRVRTTAKGETVLDAYGYPVPGGTGDKFCDPTLVELYTDTLEVRTAAADLLAKITKAKSRVVAYPWTGMSEVGAAAEKIDAAADAILTEVGNSLPYLICPECHGHPIREDSKFCKACRNTGYWPLSACDAADPKKLPKPLKVPA